MAAGLYPQDIGALNTQGSYGSLREIIELNRAVSEAPKLFCFGLLAEFDIQQMAALVGPRKLTFIKPSERARQELAPLKEWWTLLGKTWDPLAN